MSVARLDTLDRSMDVLDRLPGNRARLYEEVQPLALDAFLKLDIPEPRRLLGPFAEASLTMVHGPRGGSKTMLRMAMEVAFATGSNLFGWQSSGPVSVLAVDGEMYPTQLQSRYRELLIGAQYKADAPPPIRVLSKPYVIRHHGVRFPDLATTEGQQFVQDRLGDSRVLLLDNLSTLVLSGEENDGGDWLPIAEWLLGLRANGIAVVFFHHSSRHGTPRGTSRREDILDLVISLTRPDDYEDEQGARFVLSFTKSRGAHGDEVTPVEAQLVPASPAGLTWEWSSGRTAQYLRGVSLYRDGLTSYAEIARETNVNRSTAMRWIARAKSDGLLS